MSGSGFHIAVPVSYTHLDVYKRQVYGEKRIQVKSILNIMAAAIKCGTEVELQCTGETEEEDLKTLVTLIESGLGE